MNKDPEGKYEALDKYGSDLTELARRGKLDPVIGRDDEIRRCIQILSRRTKNNPVIIGEPGVGKTAIAEGYVTALLDLFCIIVWGISCSTLIGDFIVLHLKSVI